MEPRARERGADGEAILAAAARLARLGLAPGETGELARDVERILDAFRALAQVDVSHVEPLFAPVERDGGLRDDRERPSLAREAALANVPRREGDFIAVPKTVGGGP